MKSVSLVLGSGGARGLAHIGIIKWLEENDYKIESISGCSMGALIGGFYAAGKLDNYVEWLKEVDVLDMLKLLDFKGSGGLVSGKTLMLKLEDILGGDILIEELQLKYTAVTTDIDEEKEVWLNKGSLLNAIRASISIPLFFTPYKYKEMLLVDGGVLNPVPIAPTFHDNTDLTIAVNLGAEAQHGISLDKDTQIENSSISTKITEYLSKITLPDSIKNEDGMYVIANKSFETMQGSIARMKLATYPADIEIDVPRNLCGTFDFNKAEEIIKYGYKLCETTFNQEIGN
ncbi:MAG: patatin-like phospholipase family protein [Campylobacterota bacterium]|nr:patatin-like phospholipase family protein [Campylobacterota bacterium]